MQTATSNWMSAVDGSQQLTRLTLPGTHDSGAMFHILGHDFDQCQDKVYLEQLQSGVRFLDIRLVYKVSAQGGVNFAVHHAHDYQGSYFDKDSDYSDNPNCQYFVLQDCLRFLKDNPSECIVMSIKQEEPSVPLTTFEEAFRTLLRKNGREAKYFWVHNRIPTLDEVRGRIVIVSRLDTGSGAPGYGIVWPNWDKGLYQQDGVDVEDHYQDVVSAKWGKVSDHLDKASGKVANPHGGYYGGPTDPFWYITFVSCTPDPMAMAGYLNPWLLSYLNASVNAPAGSHRLGTILMDFPLQGAIDKIIDYSRLAYPAPNVVDRWSGTSWLPLTCSRPTRISVGPSGEAYVVNTTNEVSRFNGSTWTALPGEKATDIGVGPDGSVWIIGADGDPNPMTGGHRIFKWNGATWDKLSTGAATRISVGPNGLPYVVNATNDVWHWNGNTWTQLPGVKAADIGVGADGSVWVVGWPDAQPLTTGIYKHTRTDNEPDLYYYDDLSYNNYGWSSGTLYWYAFKSPSAAPGTVPVYRHKLGNEPLYRYDLQQQGSAGWSTGVVAFYAYTNPNQAPGLVPVYEHQYGTGPNYYYDLNQGNGYGWSTGQVLCYAIDPSPYAKPTAPNYRLFKWNGSTWDMWASGAAARIAVGPSGLPWVVNSENEVWSWNGSAWKERTGAKALDVGVGANGSVYIVGC